MILQRGEKLNIMFVELFIQKIKIITININKIKVKKKMFYNKNFKLCKKKYIYILHSFQNNKYLGYVKIFTLYIEVQSNYQILYNI